MPGKLIFLYNKADRTEVGMIFGLAMTDAALLGFEPWMDLPEALHSQAGGLNAAEEVDQQIEHVVDEAEAILYFVGATGPGPYQEKVESVLVGKALKARADAGRPLRFLPVLLPESDSRFLPAWAQRRFVINDNRMLTSPPELWAAILERLRVPISENDNVERLSGRSTIEEEPRRLAEAIRRAARPSLTLFVGPYSYAADGRDATGPAALTAALLSKLKLSATVLGPVLPWPSEAAEWVTIALGRDEVEVEFNKQLGRAGLNPPELALAIGDLGKAWLNRFGERKPEDPDWHGLLLLTTRIDLSLESALSKISGVAFTRILPTLNSDTADRAIEDADRKQMVQNWRADSKWNPIWIPHQWDPPATNLSSDKPDFLRKTSLDKAKRVVLVKLCGSVDVPPSLVLTAYDLFQKIGDLQSFPKAINSAIAAWPQVLLGRGFTSPLAQLVRAFVFGGKTRNSNRTWVMPEFLSDDESDADNLCRLELELLSQDEALFRRALEFAYIHRGPQHQFVRLLANFLRGSA